MDIFRRTVATAALCMSIGGAHATFMPFEEGVFFPDFDDSSAPIGFGLDDSRIYEYAGIFIGNVGNDGDTSDTINVAWYALKPGQQIVAGLRVGASIDGGSGLGQGQELRLVISDGSDGAVVRTIILAAGAPTYFEPN